MIQPQRQSASAESQFPLPAKQETILLYALAAMQFTHILDFMIVMPLGPRLMEIFRITPSQFGVIVSTYTFSAGFFGLLAAGVLDRFDRKTALLTLYAGFGLATLACALSPSYRFLVFARVLAGGFGGVASATILAVVGDAIPPARRGAAMGTIFSAFSLASVAGVPAGLFLANHWGWHAPFFLLGGLSAAILIGMFFILPAMRGHMAKPAASAGVAAPHTPVARPKPKAWEEMKYIAGQANHWKAFALTVMMTMAGFMIIPYISPSLVSNVGVSNEHLPLVYLCGGAVTFFSARWIGRLSDRIGLLPVFITVSLAAILPILVISNLPPVPLWVALAITTCFMVFTSGRFIPGMAMVTNSVEGRYRGGFMSINSALQQFASGLAAMLAAAIVSRSVDGRLLHYGWVGAVGSASILVSIYLAKNLKQA